MTDEKPVPKSKAKARKAPAVQSSVLAAALQDAMNGSFLNSGTDSTAALLAQMGGGGSGPGAASSGPPFKTAAPAAPADSVPAAEPEPVHTAVAPAPEEAADAATPRAEAQPVAEAGAERAPEAEAAHMPRFVPAGPSVYTSVSAEAPAPPRAELPGEREPEPEPEAEPEAESTSPTQSRSEAAPSEPEPEPSRVSEPAPRAAAPVRSTPAAQPPAKTPVPASAPAKTASAPRASRRATPAPAPAAAAPTPVADERSAHASLLDSFLDARINSKGWETWGFRLLPDVKARLGRRLTADKRSSQNRRLALGHYLNAALLELPEDNDEQIEMIRSFLRARGGITDPSQSSSYRVSPAVYELARDLDTELTATEKRGLVVYLFSAAVELFLERLDAEGALGRPEIFSPQQ